MGESISATTPYCYGGDNSAADLLDAAGAVTRFLAEVAPHFTETAGGIGLSERGACGLILVIDALEKTIDAAVKRL